VRLASALARRAAGALMWMRTTLPLTRLRRRVSSSTELIARASSQTNSWASRRLAHW